jgi:hypothetical protein
MRAARIFSRRENIVLVLLALAVVIAVTYEVATYQTSYGCGSNESVTTQNGKPMGTASINWQVLFQPCFYVYFTGIVGGSVLLILLIPVPEKKAEVYSVVEQH